MDATNVDPEAMAVAIILSQLDTLQAAIVFSQISEDRQPDIVMRIAKLGRIDPFLLAHVERRLKQTIAGQISLAGMQHGGVVKVAEILNLAGQTTQENVFKALEIRDPDLAQKIRNHMFTFNDIATALDDRGIQRLLAEVEIKELAKAMRACDPFLKERIFANVSSRVRDALKKEIQSMPPVRIREIDEIQIRITQIVNRLEETGEITLRRFGKEVQNQIVQIISQLEEPEEDIVIKPRDGEGEELFI